MTLTGATDSSRAGPRNNASQPGSKRSNETHFSSASEVKVNTYAHKHVPNYCQWLVNKEKHIAAVRSATWVFLITKLYISQGLSGI